MGVQPCGPGHLLKSSGKPFAIRGGKYGGYRQRHPSPPGAPRLALTCPGFDILSWNADGTNLPATLHRQFLSIFGDNPITDENR